MLSQNLKENRFKLRVDSSEDLWYIYHFVCVGDRISGSSKRKIKKEEDSSAKVKIIFIEIEVEKKSFLANRVKFLGKMTSASEELGKGYHSFNVDTKTTLSIQKQKLSQFDKKLLKDSQAKKEPILLGAMDYGELDLGVLTESIEYLGAFRESLPPKSNPEYERSRESFLKQAAKRVVETLKMRGIKRAVLGYVGFMGDEIRKMLPENVSINKVSVTGKAGLNEVVKRGYVKRLVSEEMLSMESDSVEELLKRISVSGKCAYGFNDVISAVAMGAVEMFMITDRFMQKNIGNFREIDSMMERVSSSKGDIMILKSSNEPGEKLDGLGGIAALLRYKIR